MRAALKQVDSNFNIEEGKLEDKYIADAGTVIFLTP